MEEIKIRHDIIIGSRRVTNYFWAIFLIFGGLGFLFAGLSSYFKIQLLPFVNTTNLVFIPQGIIMIFYGVLSLCLSIYIGLTVFWDIGGGYNEYNKIENLIKIARNGFPGKNRNILLTYSINNIKSVGIKISEGLNPKRIIFLCLKDNRKIPITQVQKPISISDLEEEATELAKFLNINLETLS